MPGRGRPPTPTAILKARGSWRAKIRRCEPQPPGDPVDCPVWLEGTARETWRELAPILRSMGVLTIADRNAFVRYCVLWANWREALSGGGRKAKKCLALSESLGRLEQQFGLTPASRARVKVDHGDDDKKKTQGIESLIRVGRSA